MISLPPIYPMTDSRLPIPLPEQVRRLGAAGFPLVQLQAPNLTAEVYGTQLRHILQESAENGGWPMITVKGHTDLALRAMQEGFRVWGLHISEESEIPAEIRCLSGLTRPCVGVTTRHPGHWIGIDSACGYATCGPYRASASWYGGPEPLELNGLMAACALLRIRDVAPVAIGGLTLEDANDCFEVGAESLALAGALGQAEDPATLLWEAQRLRWRHQGLLTPSCGVVIAGGSGGGKSTLGKNLAPRLGLPLVDLDDLIEEKTGVSIADIFAYRGEAEFRDLETLHLGEALARPCVLCLGAGAWQRPENRKLVQDTAFTGLWLAETPQQAWQRAGHSSCRPLAQDKGIFMARWRERMAAWSLLPMVLPLGRSSEVLAATLLEP